MAIQFVPTNTRTIDVAFNAIMLKTKKKMAKLLHDVVEDCFKRVVNSEPAPYKTGSYIASHRIGVGSPDSSDLVFKEDGGIPISAARTRAMTELTKIKNLKADDTVYISNSVGFSNPNPYSWARNVEYQGWGTKPDSKGKSKGKGKGRGPYLVYEKAALAAINRIPEHVTHIKETGEGI